MAKFEIKDGIAIIPEGTTEIEVSAYSDEMSWVEAIRKVLIEAGEPMHYKDITRTIIEKRYRLNFGDTPEMTVSNRLTTNPDLFKRVEIGVYELVETSVTDEMSWLEAIRKVLIEAGEPMHYKDITRTIIEKRYRLNFGDTPEMTVSNRLTTNPDLFKRVEIGVYELVETSVTDEMSWVEAIRKVLIEAGEPMHYKDITRTIIEKRYRLNFGDTPEMTVSNRLTTNPDLFKRVKIGVYGLVDTSFVDRE